MGNPTTEIDIDKRVGQYVQLRDNIKEIEARHKEELAPFKDALEQLGNLLLSHLNSTKTDSARSKSGTAFKTTKHSATLADKQKFWDYVESTEQWELLDFKANVTAVGAFIEERRELPPGVNYSSIETVNVRRG